VLVVQVGRSHKEGFAALEKTGLLGQLIRCFPAYPQLSAQIVTSLQACSQLVQNKLKSVTPTGDILDAVIAGKDGPINLETRSCLVQLQSLAWLSNNSNEDIKMCSHCSKIEIQTDSSLLMECQRCKVTLLMECQRCKVTYYCNRDRQVADWKIHKKMCNEQRARSWDCKSFHSQDMQIDLVGFRRRRMTLLSYKKSTRNCRNITSPALRNNIRFADVCFLRGVDSRRRA
jgi:hypothetical protein